MNITLLFFICLALSGCAGRSAIFNPIHCYQVLTPDGELIREHCAGDELVTTKDGNRWFYAPTQKKWIRLISKDGKK